MRRGLKGTVMSPPRGGRVSIIRGGGARRGRTRDFESPLGVDYFRARLCDERRAEISACRMRVNRVGGNILVEAN